MKEKKNTQNEAPNSSRKDSGRLLHRIRHSHCRRRLFTETYGDWGDFCQPKKTVRSSSHSSSVNLRIARCCGCSTSYCRCRVKTPVHDPHRHSKLRISDPIDRCECPPGFCRCEESVGSCLSPASMELRGGVAISNDGEESVSSWFSSTSMGLRGGVFISNEGASSCGCYPDYCRCEAKTPVHDPHRSFKIQTSDHFDPSCECPPGFCRCEESVGSCGNDGGSCGCPPGYCRCEVKTPVHDPLRAFSCNCQPGFCRCLCSPPK